MWVWLTYAVNMNSQFVCPVAFVFAGGCKLSEKNWESDHCCSKYLSQNNRVKHKTQSICAFPSLTVLFWDVVSIYIRTCSWNMYTRNFKALGELIFLNSFLKCHSHWFNSFKHPLTDKYHEYCCQCYPVFSLLFFFYILSVLSVLLYNFSINDNKDGSNKFCKHQLQI